MGNPTDETIAQLERDWPAWFFWTVPRLVGYTVWCCRRRDDPTVILNADTPEHLAEALEDQVSEPLGDESHIPAPWCPRAQDSTGWVSGSSGSERPATVAALSRRFPGWIIMFDAAAAIYTAEKREGTALHVLAAHLPSDLAMKIEAAGGRKVDG
jgi:hypothetical protein